MYWLKRLLFSAIWIFIAQTLRAQYHCGAWFRGTVSIPVIEKVKLDAEFQHRRQSGFDNKDMFDKNLMLAFRSWVHYQYNEDVKFSFSPFAYFSNYKIIQKQTDETAQPGNEVRFSAAAELQRRVLKKFYLVNRTAVEYRLFPGDQADVTRFRSRFGGGYDIDRKFRFSVFDELLFNVAGASHDHFFDHNRVGLDLECKVSHDLKFDVGYIHINRLPMATRTTLHENNVVLNLTYLLSKPGKKPAV